MATKRLNKKTKRVKTQKEAIRATENVKVVKDYPDELIGHTVVLKSIPGGIKRAKRLFEVGKKYKIQKPENGSVNTLMSVNLKGNDKKVYQVQFMYWTLTAN